MKRFDWNADKNAALVRERGVSFEEVVFVTMHGGLLGILEHPDRERYPGQRIMAVRMRGYVYLVPFVEDDEKVFLKTIIPSRKMTKLYQGETHADE